MKFFISTLVSINKLFVSNRKSYIRCLKIIVWNSAPLLLGNLFRKFVIEFVGFFEKVVALVLVVQISSTESNNRKNETRGTSAKSRKNDTTTGKNWGSNREHASQTTP